MTKTPYELAQKFLGIKEVAGHIDNPTIMAMLKLDNSWVEHDETPWCLHGDVEVLTSDGFVRFEDAVKLNDVSIACVDPETRKVGYTKEYNWVEKNYNGELYDIDTGSIHLKCDPDHRFYGKWTGSSSYSFRKIRDITSTGLGIPTIESSEAGYDISDHDLILLAAYLSDGHREFNRVNVGVSKKRKIKILDELCYEWKKLDSKRYKRRMRRTRYSFRVPEVFDSILSDYKLLSWSFLSRMSKEQCELFIKTYLMFDGNGKTEIYTADELLQKQLNFISSMAGYKATPYKTKMVSENCKIEYLYCVYISENNKNKYITKDKITKTNYSGKLYCATVPTGLIVIRCLNGSILLIGNCAGFVNYVLHLCGCERSKSLAARSYLKVGESIPLSLAEKGFDIVVFQRGIGKQPDKTVIKAPGHVAFFDNWEGGDYITVLGGNQGNEVNIRKYQRSKILDIRRVQ